MVDKIMERGKIATTGEDQLAELAGLRQMEVSINVSLWKERVG